MRRAAGLVTMAICALALSGCGADDTAQDVKEAIDPVAEAATNTAAARGARLDGIMHVTFGGVVVPMGMTGAISFEKGRFLIAMDYKGRIPGATRADMADARREAGFPMKILQTDHEVFVSTGQLRDRGRKDGIEWARIDLEEVDDEAGLDLERANQFSEMNPEALLEFLKTTGDARKTGTKTIDGVRTTRYSGTIDLRRYPEAVPAEDREEAEKTADVMIKSWGSPTQPTEVWIDDKGLIRRERLKMNMDVDGERVKGTLVVDFLDIGQPQAVELPDDDAVVDVTDEAADKLGGG